MGTMGAPSCPEGAKPTFPRSASTIFVLLRLRPASCVLLVRPTDRPTKRGSEPARPNPREGFPSIRSSVAQSVSVTYFIIRRLSVRCIIDRRVTLRADSTALLSKTRALALLRIFGVSRGNETRDFSPPFFRSFIHLFFFFSFTSPYVTRK